MLALDPITVRNISIRDSVEHASKVCKIVPVAPGDVVPHLAIRHHDREHPVLAVLLKQTVEQLAGADGPRQFLAVVREHHIDRGDAARQPNGGIAYRRNLLATLREREVARVGGELAASKGLPFRAVSDGETVAGKFTGTVQLSSGKFAIVEQSQEFTLVPWRPVIDRRLGREIMGVVQGGSVSWQMGRARGLGL